MRARTLAAALAVAGAVAAARTSPAAAQTIAVSTSSNWAGYVVGGKQFSSVSGSWVVPAARRSSEGYSAFWVGLGGASSSSSALEQVGTESDYVGGRRRYYAWYELVPSASRRLRLSVHAGDRISARVTVSGRRVTVSLADLTTGGSVTKTLRMSDPDTSSAEWIAEAPSEEVADGRYQELPLANFDEVTFTSATATAGGHTGTIADSDWTAERVQLLADDGHFGGPDAGFDRATGAARTSALRSGGSAFSVRWRSSGATPYAA
jgi:Peptidase A4 family